LRAWGDWAEGGWQCGEIHSLSPFRRANLKLEILKFPFFPPVGGFEHVLVIMVLNVKV